MYCKWFELEVYYSYVSLYDLNQKSKQYISQIDQVL